MKDLVIIGCNIVTFIIYQKLREHYKLKKLQMPEEYNEQPTLWIVPSLRLDSETEKQIIRELWGVVGLENDISSGGKLYVKNGQLTPLGHSMVDTYLRKKKLKSIGIR
jgi:hypothetical protein